MNKHDVKDLFLILFAFAFVSALAAVFVYIGWNSILVPHAPELLPLEALQAWYLALCIWFVRGITASKREG